MFRTVGKCVCIFAATQSVSPWVYNLADSYEILKHVSRQYVKQGNRRLHFASAARPRHPFPPICDAAYRQRAGRGPGHGHRQYAQKIGKDRACGSGDILADRQTQWDIPITILLNRSSRRSKNRHLCVCSHIQLAHHRITPCLKTSHFGLL